MLVGQGWPMNLNLSLGKFEAAPRRVMLPALALFALAGFVPFLLAQSGLEPTAPPASDSASNAGPAAPLPFGVPSVLDAASASSFSGTASEIPVFGRPFGAFPLPPRRADFTATLGSRNLSGAFLPGIGPVDSRNLFSAPAGFFGGLQPAGLTPIGVTGPGTHKGGFATFVMFPASANQPNCISGLATGPSGALPDTVFPPSLRLCGSAKLPASSPFGALRPSPRDTFSFGSSTSGNEFGRASTSAIFTTPDLGGGIFLSAGTGFGGRPAGTPFAPFGNGLPGPKRPGPSVAIRLSF